MSELRTIVMSNAVFIIIEEEDFGITLTKGRDEDDSDVLHLYLKQNIISKYLGDIKRNKDGDVIFSP